MSSLRVLPNSPYWIACFTLHDGTRTQRSTRVPRDGVRVPDLKSLKESLGKALGATINIELSSSADRGMDAREAKRLAQKIADHYEAAAREARAGHLTELQARKVIADIYSLANQEALQSSTIKDYCDAWLKRKELEANDRTHERYKSAIKHFLAHIGGKSARDLAHLTAKEITGLRDHVVRSLSPNSANYILKVLRAMLNQARRDGLVETNEASRVSLIQRVRKFERRPFTVTELKQILAVANEEWQGMILVGLYTGLRLGDIALLTWANLNLEQRELAVTTQKTGRRQVIPLAEPLLRFIEDKLVVNDDPISPLFPNASACKQRNPHGGPLSNQFYEILVASGLAPKRSHRSQEKGRSAKRQLNEISFHSLRHTATSLLKNAGVSDVIARDIIGHDSAAVSANYTHIDQRTKREALSKIPDVMVELNAR